MDDYFSVQETSERHRDKKGKGNSMIIHCRKIRANQLIRQGETRESGGRKGRAMTTGVEKEAWVWNTVLPGTVEGEGRRKLKGRGLVRTVWAIRKGLGGSTKTLLRDPEKPENTPRPGLEGRSAERLKRECLGPSLSPDTVGKRWVRPGR